MILLLMQFYFICGFATCKLCYLGMRKAPSPDEKGGGETHSEQKGKSQKLVFSINLRQFSDITLAICYNLFCFVLFCFVLFCFVLFCFVLFCFVLFCFVLFCFVLFCFVLFCFVLFCFVLI